MGERVAAGDGGVTVASCHALQVYLSDGTCHLLHHECALLAITDIGGVLRALDVCSPCHDATRATITGRCDECWCCGIARGVSRVLRCAESTPVPRPRSLRDCRAGRGVRGRRQEVMHLDSAKGRGARTGRVTRADLTRGGKSEQDALEAWNGQIDAQEATYSQVSGLIVDNSRCRCSGCRRRSV